MKVPTGVCVASTVAACNLLSGTNCLQCRPGSQVSLTGTSCAISCSVRNCLNCSTGVCTVCGGGFYLTNTTLNGKSVQVCVLNPCTLANCTLCNSNNTCNKCNSGFLQNATTLACYTNCTIAYCINCSGSTCYQCVSGLTYNASKKACQNFTGTTNCKVMTTKCTVCLDGFTLVGTQCVQNCQTPSCLTCSLANNYLCLTCANGYYLVSTPYYAYCNPNPCNVTNCTSCASNGSCLTCATSFLVYNSSSNKCENQCKLSNCRDCLPSATTCSYCNPGYALNNATSLCQPSNISNCPIVDYSLGYWSCTSCDANYFLDTNTYMNCYIYCTDYYCEDCLITSLHACISCFPGYFPYLINGSRICKYVPPTMPGCRLSSYNQSYCYSCDIFHA